MNYRVFFRKWEDYPRKLGDEIRNKEQQKGKSVRNAILDGLYKRTIISWSSKIHRVKIQTTSNQKKVRKERKGNREKQNKSKKDRKLKPKYVINNSN